MSSTTINARSTCSKTPGQRSTGPASSKPGALTISVAPASPTLSPHEVELQRLRGRIEELETLVALYRRREQLERECAIANNADALRARYAPFLRAVCDAWSVTDPALLHSDLRYQNIADARQCAMALIRERTKGVLTTVHIGAMFDRTNSTVTKDVAAFRDKCQVDPVFRARADRARAALTQETL